MLFPGIERQNRRAGFRYRRHFIFRMLPVIFVMLALHAHAQDEIQVDSSTVVDVSAEPDGEPEHEDVFRQMGPFTPGDKVRLRALPDSLMDSLRNSDEFWYANAQFPKKKAYSDATEAATPPSSFLDAAWFRTLVWVIIIGSFVAVLAWYIATGNLRLFERKSNAIDSGAPSDELAANIFEIDFAAEIREAVTQQQYRLATRLMFLSLLRDLAERNIIVYSEHKTNHDYLVQLQGSGWYPGFFQVVRHYEYTWYGQFEPGEEGFAVIRSRFDSFRKKLY